LKVLKSARVSLLCIYCTVLFLF